jgi:hypothetical protein
MVVVVVESVCLQISCARSDPLVSLHSSVQRHTTLAGLHQIVQPWPEPLVPRIAQAFHDVCLQHLPEAIESDGRLGWVVTGEVSQIAARRFE